MDNALQPDDRLATPPAQIPATNPDDVDWTGQVLGEFRLIHRLGRGGMGQVYLAEQTNLKRKVALKLLHPDLAGNERSLLRFKAEAENVARATHANIVQIYTIGQANGINYIALEYVEGKNLREFLEKKGTPELSLGLHVMAQVAAALQRASELGIIHRDVKPENILLTKKGEVKVADFGLSRCFAEEAQQSITQSQVAMGTPLYMSPEQVERKTVDTRTDIYSFGVTCYHMFAGTPPFRGNSPIEVAYQHVHKDPQPLQEIRPDLPAELCVIIQKMMAKKPEERYQTPREVLRDINTLREALNLGSVGAISISSSFLGTSPSGGLRGAPTQTWVEPPIARSPWQWRGMVLGSVLLALAIGLTAGWYRNRPIAADNGPNHGQGNPPGDPAKDKKLISTAEREEQLLQLVQQPVHSKGQLDFYPALKHRLDLGMFYIKHRKFEKAAKFFTQLSGPDNKDNKSYLLLGRLGHASVLAFQDEATASNAEFEVVFKEIEEAAARVGPGVVPKKGKKAAVMKDKIEAYRLLWKDNPSMREMVAKALHYNFVNDPERFPEKLQPYRFPPRASVKAAP